MKNETVFQLYVSWKNEKLRLKHKYWDNGNPLTRRDTPPIGFGIEQWHRMCDKIFTDHNYQMSCIKNKICGSTKRITHSCGSRSFARIEHDMISKGMEVDPIEFFDRTHRHKGDREGNNETNNTCDELNRLLYDAQNTLASSEDNSTPSQATIDQRAIMDGVLKTHPGRITGETRGYTRSDLKGKKRAHVTQVELNAIMDARMRDYKEEIDNERREMQAYKEEIDNERREMQAYKEEMDNERRKMEVYRKEMEAREKKIIESNKEEERKRTMEAEEHIKEVEASSRKRMNIAIAKAEKRFRRQMQKMFAKTVPITSMGQVSGANEEHEGQQNDE